MRLQTRIASLLVPTFVALAGLWSTAANAVPSFARQTGMACAACHTMFPELTAFGRQFKLDAYTFQSTPQVSGENGKKETSVQIDALAPLSVMFQASYTDTKGANLAQQGTRGNLQFPEQFSLFYAGEISPHMGAFLQVTHTDNSGGFGMDNSELRYANHLTLGSDDLLVGVVANNNPSMSDVWQTTPVWGYPWAGPVSYEKPISWQLGQSVAGVGAYALFNSTWYAELMMYKSMGSGGADTPLADNWTMVSNAAGPAASIAGGAPYARLAYQNNFGQNYVEVGLYGMWTRLYAAGPVGTATSTATSGPTDTYKDIAFDVQYERPIGNDSVVVRATAAREQIVLGAYRATVVGAANQPDVQFRTYKINGSYHFGSDKALTLSYIDTNGDPISAANYGAGIGAGTRAATVEGAYYPWENVRLSLQYTAYSKFNQGTPGYAASDNNSAYLLAWIVF